MLVNMPKLGVSMTEGTIVEWYVADGDTVEAGESICCIETDKVEQEIEAPATGTLMHRAEAGQVYEVGTLIGEIA